MTPKRYFVLNDRTDILHIYGYCRQTKPRSVPVRLFDKPEDVCAYAGRQLVLCRNCQKKDSK